MNDSTIGQHNFQIENIFSHCSIFNTTHSATIVSYHPPNGAHGHAAWVWWKKEAVGMEMQIEILSDHPRFYDDLLIFNINFQYSIHARGIQHYSPFYRRAAA